MTFLQFVSNAPSVSYIGPRTPFDLVTERITAFEPVKGERIGA